MNFKISLLLIVALVWSLCSEAQTARNPLNMEPARIALQKGLSSWKLSEEIFYHADDTPFEKRTYQYDENGQITAELTFRLSKIDQTWRNTMKSEYQYADNKEIVLISLGDRYISKTAIISDRDGTPRTFFTYSWNSDADDWSVNPFIKGEWKYDGNGRATTCLKQYIKPATNDWNDPETRIVYQYDESGVLTEELFQIWDTEQTQWTNRGRYSYLSESELRKTATSFVYVSGSWVFDGKTVYIYDEDGKIVRCEYYKYSADKTPDVYSINTYSERVHLPEALESKEINIFPNPVISSFELVIPVEFVGKTMYLFDAWGKLEKAVQVTNQTTQIDASGLISGIYLLRIGELSKKIIVQ